MVKDMLPTKEKLPTKKTKHGNWAYAPHPPRTCLPRPPHLAVKTSDLFSRRSREVVFSVAELIGLLFCRLYGLRLGLIWIYAFGLLFWILRCTSAVSIRME